MSGQTMTPKRESLLTYVVRELDATRGTWHEIAKDTGVPHGTIARIAQGRTPNPGVLTVEALANHFHHVGRLKKRAAK